MKVVLFDGVCGLCNQWVDFLLIRDSLHVLYYSPLQGEYAQEVLSSGERADLKTIVFCDDGQIYKQSTAVIMILKQLGGLWAWFSVFLLIPSCFRDMIYRFVSRNRYRWFGKKSSCGVRQEEEKHFFLL